MYAHDAGPGMRGASSPTTTHSITNTTQTLMNPPLWAYSNDNMEGVGPPSPPMIKEPTSSFVLEMNLGADLAFSDKGVWEELEC